MESTVVHCPRCGAEFILPDFPEEVRRRAVEILHTSRDAEVKHFLSAYGNISLVHASAIVVHITHSKDRCCRCQTPLPQAGTTICPHCQSLNLNW